MTRPRIQPRQQSAGIFLAAAVLLVLGCAVYWNSFDVPMVFDDLLTIRANSGVQFGDFLRPALLATRPALYLTFAINYSLHGQSVWGYHLVNLLLHVANGMLVLLIATQIFSRFTSTQPAARLYGLLAAALFLAHPVQTESVTYISSRSELLSTFFYGLAFLLFIKRDERKIGFGWSLIVAIPFLAGLFTKETVISLPATLLSYDFLFLSQASWRAVFRRWRFYVTFVAGGVAAGYFLVTTVLAHSIGAASGSLASWQYFLTELRVIVLYIRVLLFPIGLNLDYDFRPSASLLELPVVASASLLILLLAFGWYLRRRQPIAAFSIFWFFLTLAPTSSIVPIRDTIFEHRLYLPLAGVCLVFPLLLHYASGMPRSPIPLRPLAAGIGVLLVLATATVLRNEIWRDELRLWSDVVAKSPHKARPYNSLATAYFNRREFVPALEIVQRGLQNVEQVEEKRRLRQVMGQIYRQLHRYEEAAAAFRETVKTENNQDAGTAYNNLGTSYVDMAGALEEQRPQMSDPRFRAEKQQLLTQAGAAFRKSAELDRSTVFAFDSYVNVMYESGKKSDLESDLQSTIQTTKDYRAYYGLGKLAFLSGDYATAVQYFESATRLDPTQKLVFFNFAYALNQLKRRDEAIQKYLQAIRLDPLFVTARHNLALLYMQNKDFSRAIGYFEDVLRLDPSHTSAHLNLARIYIQLGDRTAARVHLSKLLNLSPGDQEAASLWLQLGS